MGGNSPQKSSFTLTQTERRVLQLLASGRDLEGAARELDVSDDEVRAVVQHVCEVTGADTPLAAVHEATRRGLL